MILFIKIMTKSHFINDNFKNILKKIVLKIYKVISLDYFFWLKKFEGILWLVYNGSIILEYSKKIIKHDNINMKKFSTLH